jgi:hypothetical protein
MILANIMHDILGTLCLGVLVVLSFISAIAYFGIRFLKRSEGRRKAARAILALVVKTTRKLLIGF